MRTNWIILTLLGIIPICIFYIILWSGGTESLQYISTTMWKQGQPSAKEIVLMFSSVISWTWVKGLVNLFLFAALPFSIADIYFTSFKKLNDNSEHD